MHRTATLKTGHRLRVPAERFKLFHSFVSYFLSVFRVAVTRSKDIPLFGPLFPKGARFPRSPAFRDFLLAKVVNAENGAEKSEKFRSMATRTRQEYLKDLAENYVTTTPIDSSTKFPLLSLGSKRKDKMKGAKGAELHSAGALVWAVMVNIRDDSEAGEPQKLPCLLGVSAESVVLIERGSRRVVFNCSCRDVIGWKAVTETKDGGPCLDIFYERGESVSISMLENQTEDIKEVVQRLEVGGAMLKAKGFNILSHYKHNLSVFDQDLICTQIRQIV